MQNNTNTQKKGSDSWVERGRQRERNCERNEAEENEAARRKKRRCHFVYRKKGLPFRSIYFVKYAFLWFGYTSKLYSMPNSAAFSVCCHVPSQFGRSFIRSKIRISNYMHFIYGAFGLSNSTYITLYYYHRPNTGIAFISKHTKQYLYNGKIHLVIFLSETRWDERERERESEREINYSFICRAFVVVQYVCESHLKLWAISIRSWKVWMPAVMRFCMSFLFRFQHRIN